MDAQSKIPAYVNGPTGQSPLVEPQSGEQPEISKAARILIAWIPYINEWRDVYECDHGRYYCLDPGDGLGSHIVEGDGIEVIETTESQADEAMDKWFAARQPMPIDLLCLACGERGGDWRLIRQVRLGDVVVPAVDGKNKRVALSADERGYFVYEHVCADSPGIDMPGVGVMPLAKVSSDCTGREAAGGEVGERSPDLAAGVHQMSLSDRMRAAVRVTSNLSEKEAAADGEPAADGGNRPPAEPAYVPDYRAIARELLAALCGMIAHFGMPTKARELSDEVETALMHAEVAKVDEVTL